MGFEKVEFEFPNDDEISTEIEIESSSATSPFDEPEEEVALDTEDEDLDEEVEIEVIDDTPQADRGRKATEPPDDVTDEELEDYSDKVRKRIKHFSKGYHDERRAKEAAERERQELEQVAHRLIEENKSLKGTVSKNQEVLLEQAKRTAAGEMILAKRAYKAAYEEGDSDKLVEAQEKMTNAKFKADKLSGISPEALQYQETPVKTEGTDEYSTPAPIIDDKANSWAATNKWFGQDDEMTSFALGLHNKLVKEGANPQTDEYYEKIDARMRQIFPDEFGEVEVEVEQRKKRTNVVAPATRSTAPRKIRLTQSQLAVSKRLGLTPKQYAAQVAIDMRKQ
mgnify:FL=1|jgi:hypothetical protein|tara:strand:+ start:429 stop:1442 length:1014 start_codon:yes stop_codon:yes gene_type:complete